VLRKFAPGLATILLAGLALWATGVLKRTSPPSTPPDTTRPDLPRFEDVAERAGVTFRHFDPATPRHLMPETMGSGVAWIDFDADGWLDLFCVQDGPFAPNEPDKTLTHRLFRNSRDGKFVDVSERAGFGTVHGFGTGVAAGDFDNDGFDDLAIGYLHGLRLFHNRPDGKGGRRFDDTTSASGLVNRHYSTSLAWGDIDGDGFLDLYVCNYVEVDLANPIVCTHPSGVTFQCSPTAFPATHHRLFRNNRNGSFSDMSLESGIAKVTPAPGLAVVMLDLDGDGKLDIYAANDLHQAYLFRNTGGGLFEEIALPSGCGLTCHGERMAGMCAEAADVDGSGRPSLFVTNFQNSPNSLFLNRGKMRFTDVSVSCGLGPPSLRTLGFGAVFLDADLDGNPDLATANGHVQRAARELYGVPYAQDMQLFLGDGRGKFREATATAGVDFRRPRVGRGVARGDFDNDGRPDLAVTGIGEPIALFRNVTETTNHWMSLELVGDGKASNRNAIGAVVKLSWSGGQRTHFIVGGGSYLSASDRRLALGLGRATQLDVITVTWPSGHVQEFRNLPAGTYWRLRERQPDAERVALSRE
jgi:hypothetical protein